MNIDEIKKGEIPKHVSIILDGNGRWAKNRGLPRNLGHRKGAINLKDITLFADQLGIKELTVYAFSTENWKRPKEEVDYLMTQPIKYFKKYRKKLVESNVKITFIGRRDRFSESMSACIKEVEELTKDHKGINLNIAFDYGSMDELTTAVKEICTEVICGNVKIDDIDEKTIDSHLFTSGMYPVDLMIRTSGEVRLSNFLIWQLAYSELYFTDVYWPDFNNDELLKAISSYQFRNRRFGGLSK